MSFFLIVDFLIRYCYYMKSRVDGKCENRRRLPPQKKKKLYAKRMTTF